MKSKKPRSGKDTAPMSCGSTEELVAENNFLLHVLLDLLIEKEIITKGELQDKLDLVESEFFVEECESKKKKSK